MKILVPLVAVGLALTGGTALTTDYTQARTVRTTIHADLNLETTSFEMERDGEPVERPGGFGGSGAEEARTIVRVDRLLEHEDGRPTKVRRAYETVGAETTTTFGDTSNQSSREGPLEGVTVALTIDDEGEIEAQVVEGDEPDDDALLESMRLAMDLDALLPEGEIEEGSSWDLTDEAVKQAIGAVLDSGMFPVEPPDEASGGGRRGRRGRGFRSRGRSSAARVLEQATWSGTATVEAMEEDHLGSTCAVIEIELESSGELPEPERRERDREFGLGLRNPSSAADSSFQVKLEGRLLFSYDLGMPILLELKGDLSVERVTERDFRESSLTTRTSQEGRFVLTMEITEE